MDKRKWLAVPVLVCLLAQPRAVHAQCMGMPPMAMTPGVGFMSVTIMLSPSPLGMCTLMSVMYAGCFPGPLTGAMAGPPLPPSLVASAMTPVIPGMTPVCAWDCVCPPAAPTPFVIGTGDGLPVELMDFSIEDEAVKGEGGKGDADDEARPEALEVPRAEASR